MEGGEGIVTWRKERKQRHEWMKRRKVGIRGHDGEKGRGKVEGGT